MLYEMFQKDGIDYFTGNVGVDFCAFQFITIQVVRHVYFWTWTAAIKVNCKRLVCLKRVFSLKVLTTRGGIFKCINCEFFSCI